MRQGARLKRDLIWSAQEQPLRLRRALLWLCLSSLLLVALFAHSTAWGRYEERRVYQESPLSPPTSPLTTTLPVTAPLSITAPITTAPAIEVTPVVVTLPVTASLPVTVNEVITAPVEEPTPTAVAQPTTTAELVNHGQVSLLLVGAVLASILVVIAVVIGRRQ